MTSAVAAPLFKEAFVKAGITGPTARSLSAKNWAGNWPQMGAATSD